MNNYITYLQNYNEKDYDRELNSKNFGSVYKDIDENRDKVISLIKDLIEWINENVDNVLTISGI